jgi:hypothetical protein
MIVDWQDITDISVCMFEGHGKIFGFIPNSFWTNSASYEYENKSADKGAQLVPIGMPTDCWTT